MKYTGEQIKKMLEYCSKQGITSECTKCELKAGDCRPALIGYALDLINRQEAEKAELQREIASCKAKIEGLKMENAQLQTDNFNANMNLEHLNAEFERLQDEIAEYPNRVLCSKGLILTKSLTEYDELINDIASEAIKEFAERLESEMSTVGFDIDDLVAEMVGED